MNAFLRWLLPVLALIGTVAAVRWLWFGQHASTRRTDGELLVFVGCCYVVADLFLLAFTRRWTLRGLGQLATYAADAGLYLGIGGTGLGWWRPYTAGDLNAIRSGFVVGGALLVGGLVAWWWATRDRETPPHEPAGGTDELVSIAPERSRMEVV